MCLAKFAVKYIRSSTGKYDAMRIAKQTPPAGVSVREFCYLNDGDPMHRLNVYRPEGAEGVLPLIINVHGGAWVYGDKDLNKYYCMYLASQGFCVAGMSYRLMDDVTLKEQAADVVAAISFVCGMSEELGADTDNVMLSGDSAGGHLSSLALALMRDPALAEVYGVEAPKCNVRCLVMSHPVGEVHSVMLGKDLKPSPFGSGIQRVFDKILFGRHPKRNPVFGHSAFSEYSAGVIFPPVMIVGCERDVYARHSMQLAGAFRNMVREGRCERFLFDFVKAQDETRKLRHVYNIVHYEWEESKRVNDLSLAFFRESMGTEKR